MASFKIELNHKPEKDQKEYALFLRITVNRKLSILKLNYSVKPNQFNPKAKNSNFIRSNHHNHIKINKYLENKIAIAKDTFEAMEADQKIITASNLKDKITNTDSKDFLEFMKSHFKLLERNEKIGNFKRYQSVYNSIVEFNKSDSLLFKLIDKGFLIKYEEYLKRNNKVQNTVAGYITKIKAVFNKAIADAIIPVTDSPFLTYKIKHGIVNKERLSITQIALIENLDLPKLQKIHHVRNSFIFAFYAAGMRVSDVLMLKWRNISDCRLSYIMNKTKKQHSFTLPKQAVGILDKYKIR